MCWMATRIIRPPSEKVPLSNFQSPRQSRAGRGGVEGCCHIFWKAIVEGFPKTYVTPISMAIKNFQSPQKKVIANFLVITRLLIKKIQSLYIMVTKNFMSPKALLTKKNWSLYLVVIKIFFGYHKVRRLKFFQLP